MRREQEQEQEGEDKTRQDKRERKVMNANDESVTRTVEGGSKSQYSSRLLYYSQHRTVAVSSFILSSHTRLTV